jgi:site-specific DNA-methyltransferase (adenine-specific)
VSASILIGDCRELMLHAGPFDPGPFDCIIADPPYGDTSLDWDKQVKGWQEVARARLKPTGSMWVFGSLRYFMSDGPAFEASGFRYAQEIVWEKHNGSSFHADRFKRVHELAVQFYRADSAWADDSLLEAVAREAGFTPDEVRSRCTETRHVKVRRRIARAGRQEGFTYQEIGQAIGRHHSTVIALIQGRRGK